MRHQQHLIGSINGVFYTQSSYSLFFNHHHQNGYSTINLKALSHIIKYFFDLSSIVQMENLGIKSNFVNCIEHLRMNTFYLLRENSHNLKNASFLIPS